MVLIIGDGRIARAIHHYCIQSAATRNVAFLSRDADAARCDILIAALPGSLGAKGLELALRYKKNLIDVSDIDPPFYLRRRKGIDSAGITVIPGCGFSPGLVNCILGRELAKIQSAESVEIKAGSLSRRKFFYPFLWCFEDLILEHRIPSRQRIHGSSTVCAPFAGYQAEKFFGIDAESYYCASGFENVLDKFRVRAVVTRVVRPRGFREFFGFMRNYGFFAKGHMPASKAVLEAAQEDNITMAQIVFRRGGARIEWMLKSFSRKHEKLNSMQKITASVPVVIARVVAEDKLSRRGLLFMEDLGADEELFRRVIAETAKEGIQARRSPPYRSGGRLLSAGNSGRQGHD